VEYQVVGCALLAAIDRLPVLRHQVLHHRTDRTRMALCPCTYVDVNAGRYVMHGVCMQYHESAINEGNMQTLDPDEFWI
jgi:hypothetical protein